MSEPKPCEDCLYHHNSIDGLEYRLLCNRCKEYYRLNERVAVLEAERDRFKAALEKIRDGGVPAGVLANVTERMLAMCDIALKALKGTE